jgi:hypothetical protein
MTYFRNQYRDIEERIAAVDPATFQGRRLVIRLFDEQAALYRELRGHPTLNNNETLLSLDSRVFAAVLRKLVECVRRTYY